MKKTKLKRTNNLKGVNKRTENLDLYLKIALFVLLMSIFLLLIRVITWGVYDEAVKIGIEQGRMEGM